MSPWRVTKTPQPPAHPGVVVHVSSAEVSGAPLTLEWVGPGEPPERRPDRCPISVPKIGGAA